MFFWRRALFIATTVFLFDWPLMQIYSHYFLTMLTVAILATNLRAFDSLGQTIIEVGSEFTMHMTSIMMSQFMNAAYSNE